MTDRPKEKKSLSTQELLSMNMDRLKEYMRKWGKDAPAEEEKRKRQSQRLVPIRPGGEILVLLHDPFHLAQLTRANDALPLAERYRLMRCQDYAGAMDKILESEFRLILLDATGEKADEEKLEVTGLDFIMILKGVAPKGDSQFLMRKQAFLRAWVPGDSDREKLSSFRIIKRECEETPMMYLTSDVDGKESVMASLVRNVKSVPLEPPEFPTLFQKLRETLS
jgi:hypothetical protein